MSALENDVKSIVTATPEEVGRIPIDWKYAKLSTWAVLKTMVWEFAHVETMVASQEEREYLRAEGKPPPGWGVWIADYQGTEFINQIYHRALIKDLVLAHPEKIQMTVICIGNTLFHTFAASASVFNEMIPDSADYGKERGINTIWPAIDIDLTRPALSDVEVNAIMDYFVEPEYGPRPPVPPGAVGGPNF